MSCLFRLAGKVEENPMKSRDIFKQAKGLLRSLVLQIWQQPQGKTYQLVYIELKVNHFYPYILKFHFCTVILQVCVEFAVKILLLDTLCTGLKM